MYEGAAQTQLGLTDRVSNIVVAQHDVEVGDKNGYAKISCIIDPLAILREFRDKLPKLPSRPE